VCYSLWYNAPTMLPASGQQHRGCIIPQVVTHSLVLLKMGGINTRNMLSWFQLLINLYCCIYLVFISLISTTHSQTNVPVRNCRSKLYKIRPNRISFDGVFIQSTT